MRIRATKPEFWKSRRIASVSWDARLVLKGLESYVDDNGVGVDDIELIVTDIFPRDMFANGSDTVARVSEAITELHQAGLLHRYRSETDNLLYISWWESIQRIDKPGKGRNPRPDGTFEYKDSEIRDTLASPPDTLAPVTEEQGNRGAGEQRIKDMPTGDAVARVLDAEVIEDEPKPKTVPNRFDEFWAAYPRKAAKGKALPKYKAATKRATQQEIIDGAHRLANDPNLPEQTYVPHPTTWLERDGWKDEDLPLRFRTRSDERMAVGAELASRAMNRPKMINPFE